MPDGIYLTRESRREPLWERADKLRLQVLGYTIAFVVASGLGLAAVLGTAFMLGWLILGAEQAGFSEEFFRTWWESALLVYALAFAIGAVPAAIWAAFAATRSETWLLRFLHAGLVPRGVLLDTKMAVKDMALAGGIDPAPALWLVDTPNVNAFVYHAPGRRSVIGVTRGLAERLPVDEQRAVFANLIARVARGDARASASLASLMYPLSLWRDRAFADDAVVVRDGHEVFIQRPEDADEAVSPLALPWFWVFGFAFVIVTELIAAGQREGQLVAAERSDAEGMLLLKQPSSMLAALDRCVRLNNYVPHADSGLADLFFCWSGSDSTDDEDDPEWRRVSRLREVLGAEGVGLRAVDREDAP